MSQAYYKIWIHLIWSTKDRQPLLKTNFRPLVFDHIRQKAKEEDIWLDTINGIENHVHNLISLHPRFSVSRVANLLKGESSHWINSEDFLTVKFAWQRGYSAFSVSESNVGKVRQYIKNQEEHHRKLSFKKEVEKLYRLHKIQVE